MFAKSDVKDMYFLSPMQEGMLFHYLEDRYSGVYFEQMAYWLYGEFDHRLLEQAFMQIVERYDVLRTLFVYEKLQKPLQVVLKKRKASIYHLDISHLNQQESGSFLEDFKSKDRKMGFNLSKDLPLRISLIKTAAHTHFMLFSFHHIILDGWSVDLINHDIMQIYTGLKAKIPVKLEPPLQFNEYIKWLEKQDKNKGLQYWRQYLEGYERPAALPKSYTKAPGTPYKREIYRFTLDEKPAKDLIDFARENQFTQSTLFQALWGILLSKYNNTNDVVFGVIVSGRSSQLRNIERMVGLLLNNIPLRITIKEGQNFIQLVKETQEKQNLAKSYEYVPLAQIQTNSALKEKIIDHIIVFENYPVTRKPGNPNDKQGLGLKIQWGEGYSQTNYDFNIDIIPTGTFTIEFRYNSMVYHRDLVEDIALNFKDLVSRVLENPKMDIKQVSKISDKRKIRIIRHFNENLEKEAETLVQPTDTLQETLAVSFLKNRNKTAIEYGSRTMTYAQLDEASGTVCQWILKKGIPKETFIGILTEDRMMFIQLALGILKAGCVMVPFYSSLPQERIELMINTTDIPYILMDEMNIHRCKTIESLTAGNREIVPVKEVTANNNGPEITNARKVKITPEDKIYIYFTSGTTGTPKAIVGKNRSLLHFIKWEIALFKISHKSRFSQFTIPTFDPYLRDIFVPLAAGGVICIPGNKDIILDPHELAKWLNENRITQVHCVASLFRLLSSGSPKAHDFPTLQAVLLCGEKINPADLVYWYETFGERVQLANFYGPTETTLVKICHLISKSDIKRVRIPIGKPIPGSRVIILREKSAVCDTLEAGEICIRTPYRSFGYYNDLRLNKEKFIVNPFNNDPNDMIYRTGDLGRILPGGYIDILGRVDRQVKIRGHRIEPEEIESRLNQHPSIEEAAVIKTETSPGSEFLCAFITRAAVKTGDQEIIERDIKEFLEEKLPDYMVPARIIPTEHIPRKANGKIDYLKLQGLIQEELADDTPPRNLIEKKLLQLWSEILGIKEIGVFRPFFHLGGNSLNMMTLISMVHREFDIRISPRELFDNSTIEQQAKLLEKSLLEVSAFPGANSGPKDKYASLQAVERKEYYPASLSQKRFYILQQLNPGNTSYNISTAFILEGRLEKRKLQETFNQLIKRHASLRTSFRLIDGELVQQVHDEAAIDIESYEAPGEKAEQVSQDFVKPFKPDTLPLLRVGLIKVWEAKHILMMDMHHIITDGLSYVILADEFPALYSGKELSPLRIQYTDFSEWQNSKEQRETIEEQGEFWLKQFADQVPVLKLRTDYPRPQFQDFAGDAIHFEIAAEETTALIDLALQEKVSIFMLLFSIYHILLVKLSGQKDIVIGTGVASRGHADLRNIVGLFFNTLPLRNQVQNRESFSEFLKTVKERNLEALEHQDYPPDLLVDHLLNRGLIKRDPSRNPLFDTMFAMQNFLPKGGKEAGTGVAGLKLIPTRYAKRTSRFDLFLAGIETRDTIVMQLEYSTALFKPSTAQKIADYYMEILNQVLADKNIKIEDISISTNLLEIKSTADQKEYMNFGF